MAQEHAAPGLGLGLVLALRDGKPDILEGGPLVASLEVCQKPRKKGSHTRRIAAVERVELAVCLENTSGKPLFLRLGAIAGGADDASALAAAGLQIEVDGRWVSAKVLEPRAVPGGLSVVCRPSAAATARSTFYRAQLLFYRESIYPPLIAIVGI